MGRDGPGGAGVTTPGDRRFGPVAMVPAPARAGKRTNPSGINGHSCGPPRLSPPNENKPPAAIRQNSARAGGRTKGRSSGLPHERSLGGDGRCFSSGKTTPRGWGGEAWRTNRSSPPLTPARPFSLGGPAFLSRPGRSRPVSGKPFWPGGTSPPRFPGSPPGPRARLPRKLHRLPLVSEIGPSSPMSGGRGFVEGGRRPFRW